MIRIPMELRETVIAIARDAGDAIMEVYAQDFSVEIKDDASPLTQADLAANRVIVEGLRRVTPDVPVLSEESAHVAWEQRQYWTSYWLVDPLDGTREFVKRNGEFSVNIALIHMGAPVLGWCRRRSTDGSGMPRVARTPSAAMATAMRCCTRAPRPPCRCGWQPAVRIATRGLPPRWSGWARSTWSRKARR